MTALYEQLILSDWQRRICKSALVEAKINSPTARAVGELWPYILLAVSALDSLMERLNTDAVLLTPLEMSTLNALVRSRKHKPDPEDIHAAEYQALLKRLEALP